MTTQSRSTRVGSSTRTRSTSSTPSEPSRQSAPAPGAPSHLDELRDEIQIAVRRFPNELFRFSGTWAQLQSEGLIPADREESEGRWPERRREGEFRWSLHRAQPFYAGRWALTLEGPPGLPLRLDMEEKRRAYLKAVHRMTDEGREEASRERKRRVAAREDGAFQAFLKRLLPPSPRARRGGHSGAEVAE